MAARTWVATPVPDPGRMVLRVQVVTSQNDGPVFVRRKSDLGVEYDQFAPENLWAGYSIMPWNQLLLWAYPNTVTELL